jgi:LmbE family N-acetylglucosaminyl deacetylase
VEGKVELKSLGEKGERRGRTMEKEEEKNAAEALGLDKPQVIRDVIAGA